MVGRKKLLKLNKNDSCLICGSKTTGLHFQVNICRACAEFYRRSISPKKTYKCMYGTHNCDLLNWSKGKRLCRYCRLKKCKELGVCLEKEEKMLTIKILEIPAISSNETISFRENSSIEDPSKIVSITDLFDKRKFKIDLSILEKKVAQILVQTNTTIMIPRLGLTFMQKFLHAFRIFYEEMRPKDAIVLTNEFDFSALIKHQTKFNIAYAKMLMVCEEYAELDFKDKYVLYKNSWRLIHQLERHYCSIKYFGDDLNDFRLLHDDKTGIDYNKMYCSKGMNHETFKKSKNLWMPFHEKQLSLLINPMKILHLTEYEMGYLIAQILWTTFDENELSEKAQKIAEEVIEKISCEIHNYYHYERGLSNYAHRLVKITKLIENSKIVSHARSDVFIMAKIGDVFECDFSKSELYDMKAL